MFTPQYAGNLAVAGLLFVVVVIAQVIEQTMSLPGGVDALMTLLAIAAVLGIAFFLGAAALQRGPRLDWSDESGEHLHPAVKAGFGTLGVMLVGLGGLALYIAFYVFQWPVIILPAVLLAISMLAFVVYLTVGRHVE